MKEAAEVVAEVVETDAAPVVRYSVADATIAEVKEKYKGLTAETPAKYKEVTAGIAEFRTMRTTLEKERKKQKSAALEFGRLVDGEAKRLTAAILEGEEALKAAKAVVDDEKARIKREEEEAEEKRVQDIQGKIAKIRSMREMLLFSDNSAEKLRKQLDEAMFTVITAEEFQEYEEEAETILKGIIEELDMAYKSRVAYEKEQEEHKAEAERLAKQKAEQDRKEAELKAEQDEKQAKLDAEREAFEEEKRKHEAEVQAKLDAEQKKKDAEALRIKLEKEAKEKAERELQEKQEREAAEAKAEEERLAKEEAARPDKEKILLWAMSIQNVATSSPAVDTDEATEAIAIGVNAIKSVVHGLLDFAEGK